MRNSLVLICLVVVGIGAAQTTPKQGSKERKAILDGIRPRIEKLLGQKVIFEVKHIRVKGDWAFVYGIPRRTNGRPIDYSKTKYAHEMAEGTMDDNFCGLLRRVNGKWQTKTSLFGMTDVGWWGWWDEYEAPRSIFPK